MQRPASKKTDQKKIYSQVPSKEIPFFTWPVVIALILSIVMGVICFMGIRSTQKNSVVASSRLLVSDKNHVLPALKESHPLPPDSKSTAQIEEALANLSNLAFEEDNGESIEDSIRHVNYAIIQVSKDLRLPAGHMQISSEEVTDARGMMYPFHSYVIQSGVAKKKYIAMLKKALASWDDAAVLYTISSNSYGIKCNDVETHRIILSSDTSSFIEKGTFSEDKKRRRQPGQPAQMVIVIDDLGANRASLNRLFALDYPLTFAFWPYATETKSGAEQAYQKGKEILIHMPMQPVSAAAPGPGSLYVSMGKKEIEHRLLEAIKKVPHATGLNNHMGSKFTQSAEKTALVVSFLKEKGLFVMDSVTHGRSVFYQTAGKYGVQRYRRTTFLDNNKEKNIILQQLRKTERIALLTGEAIAIGHPYPSTLTALEEWQHIRNHEVKLVKLKDLPSH